jgi:predicted TIM-barrel fold metal-dependent hydrolase
MRYIAIEEAFSIPELADRQAPPWPANRFSQRHLAEWARKRPDFTEYRLPEMDAAGIDVQVLSLTVPGLQAADDAATARHDARLANDYLAKVVAGRPHRFRGFAALPMRDPAAAADELRRCVPETALLRMPSEYIGSNVVITTCGVFSPAALTGAVLEIGADAILFSIDYPYESSHEAVAGLERTTLSDSDRHKIAHGNAERILRIAGACDE